jgi:hypothetical protein
MNFETCNTLIPGSSFPKITVSPPKDPEPANDYPQSKPRHYHRLHKRAQSDITENFLSPQIRMHPRSETLKPPRKVSMKSAVNTENSTSQSSISKTKEVPGLSSEVCKCSLQ